MKKKVVQRFLAMGLTMAMMLSMAACGNNDEQAGGDGSTGGVNESSSDAGANDGANDGSSAQGGENSGSTAEKSPGQTM